MKNEKFPLPEIIAAYWAAAKAGHVDEAAACFSANAVVHDEGQGHQGISAIRSWIEETTRKYSPTTIVLRTEEKAGKHLITASTSGNFPGSPLELDYTFILQDQQITNLEIL